MENKFKSIRLVVADDDEMNLEILIKNIRDQGLEDITSFEDGDVALEYISKNPNAVDVVVLDKMMPNMLGTEVLEAMKSDPKLRDIPVIIQTGFAESETTQQCLDAGAFACVTKPYRPHQLTEIICKAHQMRVSLIES